MYVDYQGNPINDDVLQVYKTRTTKQLRISVQWNYVPAQYVRPWELNTVLDTLENMEGIEHQEKMTGKKVVSVTYKLRNKYFVRDCGKNKNWIEICGIKSDGDNNQIFRYKITLMDPNDETPAFITYSLFKDKIYKVLGVTLDSIFGELPEEYHKYRTLVPPPINWSTPHTLKVIEGCTKADISSAYGTEASKPLPDLHANARKIVSGRIEPNSEYPFAFYLESGHLAIWEEGIISSTFHYNKSMYLRDTVEKSCNTNDKLEAAKDRTLLCKAAKTNLYPVFEELFNGRKEHPINKSIMNHSIGYWHKRNFYKGDDNYWPLAAVVKFRCNKRIIDLCNELVRKDQLPVLINTDSICWIGKDTSLATTKKYLGSFTLEYENCRVIIGGPRKYQIEYAADGELKCLTRWSGPHGKDLTSKLCFGDMLIPGILKLMEKAENENTYRWSNEKRRFVNAYNEVLVYKPNKVTEDELLYEKSKSSEKKS